MKNLFENKALFGFFGVFVLILALVLPSVIFSAPSNWYVDYTYSLDSENRTITVTSYNGTSSNVVVPSKATIDSVDYDTIIQGSVFKSNPNLEKVTFEDGVKAGTSIASLFYNSTNLKEVVFNNFDTSNVTSMRSLFNDCQSLESISGLEKLDTSKVKEMNYMFYHCYNLNSIDLSNFNTSNVTTMQAMFSGCEKLESLNLSNFNTSNVTIMSTMFYNCSSLKSLNLNSFNTSNVTSMAGMFNNCSSLDSLNLNSFNTSNVTSMASMFNNCAGLKSIDVSGFDTKNVTTMQTMFNSCSSLKTLDISNFTINENTNIREMLGATEGRRIGATKIKLGSNMKTDGQYGFIMRGTWRKEETGEALSGLDIYKKMLAGNPSGTYSWLSTVSSEMNINFPVTYKIGKISKIDEFSTTNSDVFATTNNTDVIVKNIPITTTDEYSLPGKVELLFNDVVTDAANNKYDLKMTVENIKFYDLAAMEDVNSAVKLVMELNNGSINLEHRYYKNLDNYYLKKELTINSGYSSVKYDVTFNVLNKDGTKAEGSYIFSVYDLDVPSIRDNQYIDPTTSPTDSHPNGAGFGNYSEGVTLNRGFDMDTLKVTDPTKILRIDNRFSGTSRDGATELSEFLLKAEAKESNFSWTSGGTATTTLLSQYQPTVVSVEKEDENGGRLKNVKFELYYGDDKIDEWTTDNSSKDLFLNPGKYTLKEIEAPTGYKKIDDIIFFVDINDTITRDGKKVDKIVVKNEYITHTVVTHYYKEETNESLGTDIVETKRYGDTYSTQPLTTIPEGYELVKTPSNASGTIEDSDVIVIYYYRLKDVALKVKHLEEGTNNVLAPEEVYNKKYGDNYTTSKSNTVSSNYEVSSINGNASGTINSDLTVTYYYKLKEGKVVVHHYVDGTTTKLTDDETITKKYTEQYETSASTSIPSNYVLKEVPNNYKGVVSKDQEEVIYYYVKKDPNISQEVSKSGTEVINSEDQKIEYNISYNVNIKDVIENVEISLVDTLPYKIDTSKSNLDGGVYDDEHKTITWSETVPVNGEITKTYAKKIEVVYKNVDASKDVVNSIEGKVKVGAKEVSKTAKHITSIVKKGEITVKYVDSEGNDLTDILTSSGNIGDSYTTVQRDIEGYRLVRKPNVENYTYSGEPQTVTYVYERIKLKVKTIANEGGSITGDEDVLYKEDSTKDNIVITANDGYVIDEISINGEKVGIPVNSTSLVLSNFPSMVEDKTVEVTFRKKGANQPLVVNVPKTFASATVMALLGLSLLIISLFVYYKINFKAKIKS